MKALVHGLVVALRGRVATNKCVCAYVLIVVDRHVNGLQELHVHLAAMVLWLFVYALILWRPVVFISVVEDRLVVRNATGRLVLLRLQHDHVGWLERAHALML